MPEKQVNKMPFYKKWWVWTIVVLIIILAIGIGSATSKNVNKQEDGSAVAEDNLEYSEGPMREIEKTIRSRVKEKYEDVSITKLLIFDDTNDNIDNYVVMVYLNWNRKNKSTTAKDMLKTYSSDLAATLGNENEDVNAVNIYWRIPYLEENGNKVGNGENYWIYARSGANMILKDQNWIHE